MKIYLAGPMRGLPLFNFPAFFRAATTLRALGHEVANPAEHDMANGFDPSRDVDDAYNAKTFSLSAAFAWDFEQVSQAEAIVLLPGWRKSSGAQAELILAYNLGVDVYEYDNGVLDRIQIHGYRVEVVTDDDLREEALVGAAGGRMQAHTEAGLALTPEAQAVIDDFFGSHTNRPDVLVAAAEARRRVQGEDS